MSTIYTLGYTGLKPATLLAAAVDLSLMVIDTRFSPRSRNPQWNIAALRLLLGERHYRHIFALGNRNYRTGKPFEIVNLYVGTLYARRYLDEGTSILLLCACPEVAHCHRSYVAQAIQEATECPIVHWTLDGIEAAVREAEGEPKQLDMFGGLQ